MASFFSSYGVTHRKCGEVVFKDVNAGIVGIHLSAGALYTGTKITVVIIFGKTVLWRGYKSALPGSYRSSGGYDYPLAQERIPTLK